MPYNSTSEVPSNVPENKRNQFKEVFNSVYSDTQDEGKAMAAAYSAIKKASYTNDIFTTEMEARARSMDLGLGGAVHVHEYGGQAVYMPGSSHEEYLDAYRTEDEEEEPKDIRMEALRCVVREILQKAEYDGREVELDKPFCLPEGSSKKFGVYVEDTSVSEMTKADIEGEVLKLDEEQRLVYGWASVITKGGEPVIDRQGDVIKANTLVKAVNKFMEFARVGKEMHSGNQIGMVLHSWPVTEEISKAVGIQSDQEGWLVAFKVYDDEVWSRVKSGELKAFSIGGKAIKEDYNA